MTIPAMDESRAPAVAQGWQRVALPIGLGLVLLGLVFRAEVMAALRAWHNSTAYNHCYLIIPIALYLLWERRGDLIGLDARPMPAALLLGIPLAAIWLVAERLGIMEGRQLVAMSFVQVLFLAVLGRRLWWAMCGPLLYLYFLVPFGEFLTPRLQDVTTWFVMHGLQILGIPAYIDGYVIEIPQGTFFIAEACAGLRFLIASIAFGCLYALLMYRSTMRRTMFILMSIVVPVIANGFRALGIVSLGWLLGSAEAAATDHVLYGWLFFSTVIVILILLGLPFREDDQPTREKTEPTGVVFPLRTALALALGTVVLAAISPSVAAKLDTASNAMPPGPMAIDMGPGCIVRVDPTPQRPMTERVDCGGLVMDVAWAAFSPRSTAAPVMAERRRMVIGAETEGLEQHWFTPADGSASAWRIMKSNDPAFVTAVAIWVEGKPVRPGLSMRMRMAMDSLFGSRYAPMVVTVTPVVDWEALHPSDRGRVDASVPAFLQRNPGLDAAVGRRSAL